MDLDKKLAPHRLICLCKPMQGTVVDLETYKKDLITIGRSRFCTITIEDESVSVQHCIIIRKYDNSYWIKNTCETGTYVNYEFIEKETKLEDGDVISLENFEMLYESRGNGINNKKANKLIENKQIEEIKRISSINKMENVSPFNEKSDNNVALNILTVAMVVIMLFGLYNFLKLFF